MNFDDKLKKELRIKLEDYYQKFISKSDVIDMDLMMLMAYVTDKTGFEVAVLINRKGKVVDIAVGNRTSVMITNEAVAGRGFNGVRLIHTHPSGNSQLSELDLSALSNSLYDTVVAIGVNDGDVTTAHAGFVYLDDEGQRQTETLFVHNAEYINKFGILEKVMENEKQYRDKRSYLHENQNLGNRAILVAVEIDRYDNIERDLAELANLAETAKVEVVGVVSQKRDKPDGKYFIGEGKLEELRAAVQNENATLVIFDNVLTGSKQNNLQTALGVDVIDRSMLILDIFAKRAKTNEGKLQVELAQLKYLLPRVGNMIRGHEGSGNGIGLKGPGESKIELNRRIIENNINKIEKELDSVKRNRKTARANRLVSSKKIVSIVGYTNSGKSTIMNVLSRAGVYEKDELFATLDTTTRNVWLNEKNEMLLVDTVGFINKLPHEFINAFSSTLEESVFADLLLHVIDASDKAWQTHNRVVLDVLKKIGADAPIVTVFNKIDKIKSTELEELKKIAPENSIFVSAKRLDNIDVLKNTIIKFINK